MSNNNRFFWIKLKHNFFDTDDIRLIEKMQNGAKYIIFWQKLLLKAITSNEVGVLRYKENIPYTPNMLSTVTSTDIDTVKAALDVFVKLGMVGILPDGSFWLEEAQKMVGSETKSAQRKRKQRSLEKQTLLKTGQNDPKNDGVTLSQNSHRELELELELELEKETDKEKDTNKEVNIPVSLNIPEFLSKLEEWVVYRKEKRKPLKDKTLQKQINFLSDYKPLKAIEILEASMRNDWIGLFSPKEKMFRGAGFNSDVYKQEKEEFLNG